MWGWGCKVERSGRRQSKRKQTKRVRGNRPGVRWWWWWCWGGERRANTGHLHCSSNYRSPRPDGDGKGRKEVRLGIAKTQKAFVERHLRGNVDGGGNLLVSLREHD